MRPHARAHDATTRTARLAHIEANLRHLALAVTLSIPTLPLTYLVLLLQPTTYTYDEAHLTAIVTATLTIPLIYWAPRVLRLPTPPHTAPPTGGAPE